ncbi:MAG: hypothetical protein H7067_17280, partial [Burkholderiales bacterium]|nr:hypothetical protein [Opitutaceae bacterium]
MRRIRALGLLLLFAVVVGALWWFNRQGNPAPTPSGISLNPTTPATDPAGAFSHRKGAQ